MSTCDTVACDRPVYKMPAVKAEVIRDHLLALKLGVEVFLEFPSEGSRVRHGVYISDVSAATRSPAQLGLSRGASIYYQDDTFQIIQITFQGDKTAALVTEVIEDLVYAPIFDGYHERDYTMTSEYLNRAEYRTYDFTFRKIQTQ